MNCQSTVSKHRNADSELACFSLKWDCEFGEIPPKELNSSLRDRAIFRPLPKNAFQFSTVIRRGRFCLSKKVNWIWFYATLGFEGVSVISRNLLRC